MNKITLGLLSITAIGTLAMPVKADVANVQTSTQINTQEGVRNSAYQKSTQEIRSSRYGRSRRSRVEDEGNIQDAIQDSFQEGYSNYGRQDSYQKLERSNRMRR